MQHKFKVTGLGIQIDGRAVLPGSILNLKSRAPAHWQRFGENVTAQDEPKDETVPSGEGQPKRRGRSRRQEPEE